MSRNDVSNDSVNGDNSLSSSSDELNEDYFTNNVPDCLVLKIIEYEKFDSDMDRETLNRYKDMRIFIIYDIHKRSFIIRGKRRPTSLVRTLPFSYECTKKPDVLDFIQLLIPTEHYFSMELYNVTDLPTNSNEITYQNLSKSCKLSSMIVAYDNENVSSPDRIHKSLYSLQHIYNEY